MVSGPVRSAVLLSLPPQGWQQRAQRLAREAARAPLGCAGLRTAGSARPVGRRLHTREAHRSRCRRSRSAPPLAALPLELLAERLHSWRHCRWSRCIPRGGCSSSPQRRSRSTLAAGGAHRRAAASLLLDAPSASSLADCAPSWRCLRWSRSWRAQFAAAARAVEAASSYSLAESAHRCVLRRCCCRQPPHVAAPHRGSRCRCTAQGRCARAACCRSAISRSALAAGTRKESLPSVAVAQMRRHSSLLAGLSSRQ